MKKSLLSALLVCSLTLATIPTVASADTIDEKIEQQDQKINSLKGQQADVQSQISALEAEIATVSEKVSDLEAKQEKLNNDTMKLQDKIATLKLRIAKREDAIKKQARDVQVNGQSTNFIDVVANAESISDAIGKVTAMTTIVNANNDLVEQQKADKKAVEVKVKENEEKIAEVAANRQELEDQKNAIASKQADLNVLKANLAAEQATAENDKAALNKQKQEAEAEAARVRQEQEAAAKAQKEEEARQAKLAAQNEAKAQEAQKQTLTVAESNSDVEFVNVNKTESNTNSNTDNNTNTNNNSTGGGNGVDHSGSGNAYMVGQCTWYVKNVCPWAGTYWGNGAQWGASAAADGYRVDGTPAAGAIVVFAGGQSVGSWNADPVYGHVAYVESYNASNNTITISQGGMGFSSPTGPNIETLSASGLTYIHR